MKVTYSSRNVSDADYFVFSFKVYDDNVSVNEEITTSNTTWVIIKKNRRP